MKKKLIRFGLFLATVMWTLTSACTSINSGNLGHDVRPPKYGKDEEAITSKVVTATDAKGRSTITTEATSLTGLEVARQIELKKLETARDVGVARAISGSGATRGFWSSLLGGPANYYGGSGGTYYGQGDNSAGGVNTLSGGGNVTTGVYYNNSPGGANTTGGSGVGIQGGYNNGSGGVNIITRR